jgi:hypothetical protein
MFSGWSGLRDRPALLTLVSLGRSRPRDERGSYRFSHTRHMLSFFRLLGHRFAAWFVHTFLKPNLRDGIAIYDLRAGDQTLAPMDAAMEYLHRGEPEYLRLVRENLHAIHISRGGSWVLVPPRVYATPFQRREATDGLYLASRFVWAAQYLSDMGQAPSRLRAARDRQFRRRAYERQLDFIRSTGKEPHWIAELEAESEKLVS